ncbi:MAG: two-component hybrid sensor and regulator [Rhodospirillales bacterium]|jgi:CheY-like chemotaxis protein|nr:two-component hybrid sensor and regulator [Rhodospirillales bacterium]
MSDSVADTNNASTRILVVDDEPFNRTLVKRLLDAQGYTNVSYAENGRLALEEAGRTRFDVILLDIEMPEMDGIAVLKALKADLDNRHVPVIMISGDSRIESVVACIEMGADDYLQKPFNPVLLQARLGACIEKRRLHDQEESHLRQIRAEKRRSDELLNIILPSAVAGELKATGKVQPRSMDNVAVLFCDIVSFTTYCGKHSAEEIVGSLQILFTKFEAICAKHKLEKIKTIGDAFMAAAGLTSSSVDPLLDAVKCGLDMTVAAPEANAEWKVRVGVHAGPLTAGIVGDQKYQFDVWGDTVNIASRMAGAGSPSCVTMMHQSWLQVQDQCVGKSLGSINVKGKGAVDVVEVRGLRN